MLDFDLVDLVCLFSCFGEYDFVNIEFVVDLILGFMFYNNCENDDFDCFDVMLISIE